MTSRSPSWWYHAAFLALVAVALALQYDFLFSARASDSHESPSVYLRIHQYATEWASGRLPQSFPDVAGGGGSAFPRFYPPLAYYLTAGIYLLTQDVVWAAHLSFLLSVLLSGASLVWALLNLRVGWAVALVGGAAYATLPYRLTVVAARGALAESWAFVWLPLLMVGCWQASTRERTHGKLLPLALAGLLLTHTATALWAAPILAIVALVSADGIRASDVLAVLRGCLVGGALAACYLLPMWWYLPTVWASDGATMWATTTDFANWGVPLGVLFGNGLFRFEPNWPMRLSHGAWGLIVPFSLLLLRHQAVAAGSARRAGIACGLIWMLLVLVVLAPAAVAPLLPKPLLYLQFPYRLIGLMGLLGATGLALIVSAMRGGSPRNTLCAVWAVAVVVGALHEAALPTPPGRYTHQDLVTNLAEREDGLTVQYEYFPRSTNPRTLGTRVRAAERRLAAKAETLTRSSGSMTVALRLSTDTSITLPLVAYDFIELRNQEGKVVPSVDSDGLVQLALSPGQHVITVTRRVPYPYWIGAGVTLLAVLALLWGRPRLPTPTATDEPGHLARIHLAISAKLARFPYIRIPTR